jgi:O-antigen/teichoic acid export membrane protein
MSLARIAKLFAAQNLGQLVSILTQALLPPAFLHAYGVKGYGQWLALSAAISYLSTFNYGLQTYTNMQMTIHYNGGEVEKCRHLQSAGLRILFGFFLLAAVILLVVFLLPLDSLLHLTIPRREAQWTLYFLGSQIMASMIAGFFSGNYMVIGAAHRAAYMQNITNLTVVLVMTGLALHHAPFALIAASQVGITLTAALLYSLDFRRLAPDLKPTLRYWTPGALKAILKPSGQYALLYSSNVLAYQVPILLMQRILGPVPVVIYNVTRTIYSMSRRLLFLVTNSIGPEVTLMYGKRDWARLHRLYELSERIILLMTAPITFGTLMATPLLLQVWLHKGTLFDPLVSIMLGLTVTVLGIKEHKYQFQFSSNQVAEISYMTLAAYGLMVAVSIPVMKIFGLPGFVTVWFISEVVQLFYLLYLNEKLFAETATVDRRPVYQLFALMAAGTALLVWPLYHIVGYPYLIQGMIAAGVTLAMLGVSYWIFGVDEVRSILWRKASAKFPALASRRG